MRAAFGVPENAALEAGTHRDGDQYYRYILDDVCLNSLYPIFYSYDCERGRLLSGYSGIRNDQAAAPDLLTGNETIRLLEEAGLTLSVRQAGSQTGKAVNERMRAQAEDLEWEKAKSGDEWRELPDDAVVSRFVCAQVLEGIPLYPYSRDLKGTDSFTYDCETKLYFIDEELVFFSGGVYSSPVKYGEMAPLISAERASELFAADYNLLVGAPEIFCDTIRLEYMAFPEPGSLIYSRWRLEPVWVFYEDVSDDQAGMLGGVHALTGEVIPR